MDMIPTSSGSILPPLNMGRSNTFDFITAP
jgi:hypothetical protein